SSAITLEAERSPSYFNILDDNIIPVSSEHIYINLQYHDDKPPVIPTRTTKQVQFSIQMSPPPPAIPPRNEQKQDTHSLSS
ncbi:unnamed protein product, partial [Rotaria magnacalcarata]